MNQEPSLYGHTAQGVVDSSPTAYEWVELIHKFWPGAVALGVAWIGYKTWKLKSEVNRRNKILKNYNPDNVGEETMIGLMAKKIKGEDKDNV